jgi:BirA family biotin operon repressor/biotin-[acetyl-CoA-carboxylase] ligase
MSAPDRLHADHIQAVLRPVTIGRKIIVLQEAASTNDVVFEKAREGCVEGLVVFAEHQTAGRGQHGKKWESVAFKGLWLSILLRPVIEVRGAARLTSWAAETVASMIKLNYGIEATVKPPNDIYVLERKLAGVLVEMRAQAAGPHLAILGIGLNVNQAAADFPEELRDRAISLAIATGARQDRSAIAVALLRNLDQTYRQVATDG